MTKLADELEALAKAIRAAIEYMPYLDRQKEDDDGDYLPLTLREFYEETWQGSYADELFQDLENVIIAALRQPDAVPDNPYVMGPPPAGVASYWPDDDGVMQPTNDAAAIQSLTAERDAALERVAELEAGLHIFKRIADQTNKYPKGSSAGVNVDRLRDARALLEGSKP